MTNTSYTLILVATAALVTFLVRVLPFIIFNEKSGMPQGVKRVADALPPAIMGVLVIYCLKDSIVNPGMNTVASFVAALSVVLIHLWRKNTLLSILVGTVVYMLLIRM